MDHGFRLAIDGNEVETEPHANEAFGIRASRSDGFGQRGSILFDFAKKRRCTPYLVAPGEGRGLRHHTSPVVSGRPSMILRFCTAAPLAPLPRLSNTAMSRACWVLSF